MDKGGGKVGADPFLSAALQEGFLRDMGGGGVLLLYYIYFLLFTLYCPTMSTHIHNIYTFYTFYTSSLLLTQSRLYEKMQNRTALEKSKCVQTRIVSARSVDERMN